MPSRKLWATGRPTSRSPSPPDSFDSAASSSTCVSTGSNPSPPPSPQSSEALLAPSSLYNTPAPRLRHISPPQTLLGAIDENSGRIQPDVPLASDKENNPVAKLHTYSSAPGLKKRATLASMSPPPRNEFDLLMGPNGERFVDMRMNRKMQHPKGKGSWRRAMCFG